MSRRALCLAALVLLVAAPAAGARGQLPGSTDLRVCAAAGDYWPTMTLTLARGQVWVACKEQLRVLRVDPRTGKVGARVTLFGPPIAVASGFDAVWALDGGGTLYRIDPASGRVLRRLRLGTSAPYNLWLGAGSVWVADDAAGAMLRISATGSRVLARIPVGDGPADMAFDGTQAWVVDHRDKGLVRIDTRTNTATKLATLDAADAPERIARLGGKLWITGRGTDVLRVDPASGVVEATIDVDASGIDIVSDGGGLWVPSRSAAVDPTGFPTMQALRHVSADGTTVAVATASGRLDVHGLVADRTSLWLADNRNGVLHRIPLLCGDLATLELVSRLPTDTAAAWRHVAGGSLGAARAARAHAPAERLADATAVTRLYTELAALAERKGYDPAAIAATPDAERASAATLAAAQAAAGRLGAWARRACPRAYDVV